MITSNVSIDLSSILPQVQESVDKTQIVLDEQVLKDSNYFIPFDTANLRDSSLIASEIGKGVLLWDTPYAKRLYWNPQYNFSKDSNPHASGLWFDHAKAMNLPAWIALTQTEVENNL
ncbi:minor capsid protein [Bacillus paranthracis]|uniref:minor capsid protein n=1 Tax=Bacillus paranthracis TaxID=2026186 RepID=UPI003D64A1B9